MKPIKFSFEAQLTPKPEEIANQILYLSRWPEFNDCCPVPRIKHADFETKTAEVVGTRIQVTNRSLCFIANLPLSLKGQLISSPSCRSST